MQEFTIGTAAAQRESLSPRGLAIFAICFFAWMLYNLDQSTFAYIIPGILTDFHQPLSTVGRILAISFVVSSVLVVICGVAGDRFGRGNMLALLLGGSACAVGLQSLAGGVVSLTILRSLSFGLGGGLSPITNAYVVETMPARMRGIAVGILQCAYPLGWFAASLLSAPLLATHGWRGVCVAGFVVAPMALPIWWLLRRADRRPGAQNDRVALPATAAGERGGLAELFDARHRVISVACIVTFLCFAGAYAGSAFFFTSFFVAVRHYTPSQAVSLVGSSNAVAVVGYLAAALIGEFLLTRRTVFVIWLLAGAAAMLGLVWLPRTHAEDFAWYALMASSFYGAAAVFPVMIAELFPARIRATALAFCGSMPQCLGFACFPLIVPLVVQHVGWQMAFSLVVVPPMIVAACSMLVLPKRLSGEALPDEVLLRQDAGDAHFAA